MSTDSLVGARRTLTFGTLLVVVGLALCGGGVDTFLSPSSGLGGGSLVVGISLAVVGVTLVHFGWVFLADGFAGVVAVGVDRAG